MIRLHCASAIVAFSLLASAATASADSRWVLWFHVSGTTGWEKWIPQIQFDTKEDCTAAVVRALAAIKPPDHREGDTMVTPTASGGAVYTQPLCFTETFDPRGPKRGG